MASDNVLHCFLYQLAGEDGVATADILIKEFQGNDIRSLQELKGLQLGDLDGGQEGTDPLWWDSEV